MKNTDETTGKPGLVLTNCRAGRMVCSLVWAAPEAMPTAWPLKTITVPE
jgi:hypothetical protein